METKQKKTYEELASMYEDAGDYVRLIANEFFPSFDGEDFYESNTGFDVFRAIENGDAEFSFTDEEYYNSADIQDTLDALGIDYAKFLYALKFVHHIGECKFVDARILHRSAKSVVDGILERLVGEDALLTVRCKGKKKLSVDEDYIMEYISLALTDLCEKLQDDTGFVGQMVLLGESDRTSKSTSMRMAYEAKLLKFLIDATAKKDMPVEDNGVFAVSRDRLLLISRLMFLTGLTDNEGHNRDTDNIKGIISSYKDKEVMTVSRNYFV